MFRPNDALGIDKKAHRQPDQIVAAGDHAVGVEGDLVGQVERTHEATHLARALLPVHAENDEIMTLQLPVPRAEAREL